MTVEDALRQALAEAPRGRVTFPDDLQGFPGTVHGGAVAALLYRVTTPRPPARIRLALLRGVPTATPLRLTTGSAGTVARLGLAHDDRGLAEAELARVAPPAIDAGATVTAWQGRQGDPTELPRTATCLACGTANPLGLALSLRLTERWLWGELSPPAHYRAANGLLHPALATIALDELGWWLGATAQAECGVTTEVAVTVLRPLPFEPVLLLGDRDEVRTDEDDARGRFVRARTWLLTGAGQLLAFADVRFAGSPAYTKRLLQPFLEATAPEELFRLFPRARALAARPRAPAPPAT